MDNQSQSPVGMLTLSLGECSDAQQLKLAAEGIGRLPGVLRIRTELELNKLEIVFQNPAKDLLRAIHTVLQSVRDHPELLDSTVDNARLA